jgi:enterochelin esterase-like enzyme
MKYDVDFISFRGAFHSAHLNRKVHFRWVAPAHYRESDTLFPVLLMNDGQDFNALGLERSLTACYASRAFTGFVYVGLETNHHRIQEYGTASSADFKGRGKKAGAYSRFVVEEFIPFLKSEFRLSPRKEDWVYCGMSLGGLSALDIVIGHPNLFGKAGVFSGSFWWRNKAYVKHDMADRSRIILDVIKTAEFSPHLQFWFQCGTADETADRNKNGIIDSIDDTLDVIRELEARGYQQPSSIRYVQVEGGKHDLPTWQEIFPDFLDWAFKNKSKAIFP